MSSLGGVRLWRMPASASTSASASQGMLLTLFDIDLDPILFDLERVEIHAEVPSNTHAQW